MSSTLAGEMRAAELAGAIAARSPVAVDRA
jgi:hypothetical protein